MFLLVATCDLLEILNIFLVWIPVLGQISFFALFFWGFITWITVQIWLWFKGIKAWYFLAGNILEEIGVVFISWLPLRTVTLIITIAIANTAEKLPVLKKVQESGIIKKAAKIV